MKTIKLVIALATAVLISSACSTTVQSDFDLEADFTQYSTFAWFIRPERNGPPTMGANQIVDSRIRRAIADELTAKGFSQTSPEKADLLVTYYTSLSSELRMYTTGWGYGWGYGPYWRYGYGYWPGWGYAGTYVYHEGTIIVDIIDRQTRRLVWRGVVTRALSKKSSSPEKIDKAIARVMRGFPPA